MSGLVCGAAGVAVLSGGGGRPGAGPGGGGIGGHESAPPRATASDVRLGAHPGYDWYQGLLDEVSITFT